MDKLDTIRLEALKREKAENEKALMNAMFPNHAERLQTAIRSQERAIARLEQQA